MILAHNTAFSVTTDSSPDDEFDLVITLLLIRGIKSRHCAIQETAQAEEVVNADCEH